MNKFFIQVRKYWWAIGLGAVILGLLVGLISLINSEEDSEMVSAGEVAGEVARVEEGVDFRNGEFVEKFLGDAAGAEAVEIIEETIFEDLGGKGSFSAFAAGSDVTRGVAFPFDMLEFSLQVAKNDASGEKTDLETGNATYEVQLAMLKDAYYGILIETNGGEKLIVKYIRPAEEAGYTEAEAQEKLRRWAEGARN